MIIRRSLAKISQAVVAYKRNASFTHSRYWRICFNSVPLSIFNMEDTTVEQWHGCAA